MIINQIEEARVHLAEFQKAKPLEQPEGAVECLENAIHTLANIDLSRLRDPTRYFAVRHQSAQAWLAALREIDRSLDPNFDPKDVPAVSIVPPRIKGVGYPSGVDPKAIPDPEAWR